MSLDDPKTDQRDQNKSSQIGRAKHRLSGTDGGVCAGDETEQCF